MAEGTVVQLSLTIPTNFTSGVYTSSAYTLSSDFIACTIKADSVDGGYPVVTVEVSNDGTTYVEVPASVDNYEMPTKTVMNNLNSDGDGEDHLTINGLDYKYAKVLVYSAGATTGTITVDVNY